MTIFYQTFNNTNIFDDNKYFNFTRSAEDFLTWYYKNYYE